MGSQNLAQFEAGVNMKVAAICLVIFVVSMICESAQLETCKKILGVKCKDLSGKELCKCPTFKPDSVCRQWKAGHSYCQSKLLGVQGGCQLTRSQNMSKRLKVQGVPFSL